MYESNNDHNDTGAYNNDDCDLKNNKSGNVPFCRQNLKVKDLNCSICRIVMIKIFEIV